MLEDEDSTLLVGRPTAQPLWQGEGIHPISVREFDGLIKERQFEYSPLEIFESGDRSL